MRRPRFADRRATQALSLLDRAKQLAKYPVELAGVLGEMMLSAKAAGMWQDVHVLASQLSQLPLEAVPTTLHTSLELVAAEAYWATRLSKESISPLERCVQDTSASPRHRIDAALLLVKMSHELGEIALARRAFGTIESLLLPDSKEFADRVLPLIYHTSFGDRGRALEIARALRSDLGRFQVVEDQLRAANNVSLALGLLGEVEECVSLCNEYYEKTGELGLGVQQAVICSLASAIYSNIEDFSAAEYWHSRVELHLEASLVSILGRTHFMNDIEIALWKGDERRVRIRLDQLAKNAVGDTIRGKGFLRGSEVRLWQLQPEFDCSDETIRELFVLWDANKNLFSADGVTVALAEALKRRGKTSELRLMLDEYLHHARRELTPAPRCLARLWALVQ